MDDISTVWTVASVVTGTILTIATLVTGRQRGAYLMVSFFPMAVAALIWAPTATSSLFRVAVSGVIGTFSVALFLVGAAQLLFHKDKASHPCDQASVVPLDGFSPPRSLPGFGNYSIGQQGGSVNQTYINQIPAKLTFTPKLGAELLARIPRDKNLDIVGIGSASDWKVGEQISSFLQENGYKVSVSYVSVLSPSPNQPLTLREYSDSRRLDVAPSV